jgi:ATP-binding protein involved in chromosome partitioning
LLDADIYGPSQPLMMGLSGRKPLSEDGKHLTPLRAHGVAVMSIGFLIDPAQPMAWRGPMVTQALSQLLGETNGVSSTIWWSTCRPAPATSS